MTRLLFLLVLLTLPGLAQSRVVNNPEGGAMALTDYPGMTPEQALAASLRSVQQVFLDKPRVSTLLRQTQDGTLAMFFEVQAKNEDQRMRRGLILVAPGCRAAVLVDYPERFGRTGNQMLKALFGGPGGVAQSNQLIPTTFPDGSATMSLLPGWQVVQSEMGQGLVRGPNGEVMTMYCVYWMSDPGAALGAYPVASRYDLADAWLKGMTVRCQRTGSPVPSMQITGQNPQGTYTDVDGFIDLHDGVGVRVLKAHLKILDLGSGVWTVSATSVAIPQALAAQEMPAVLTMIPTYRENAAVINAQAQQKHQAQVDWFANQQAGYRAQQAAGQAYVDGYWARQDSQARSAQAFSNYILDNTVITDAQGRHGTFSNLAADALVQAYPGQFQVVNSADFLKSVDY